MISFSNFLIYFSLYIACFQVFFFWNMRKIWKSRHVVNFLFLIVGWSPIFSSKPIHSYSLCASLLCALPVTDIYIYIYMRFLATELCAFHIILRIQQLNMFWNLQLLRCFQCAYSFYANTVCFDTRRRSDDDKIVRNLYRLYRKHKIQQLLMLCWTWLLNYNFNFEL
jgi:hypothetical protein